MHKNLFWQAFVAVVFCACLVYTVITLYHYHTYQRLTDQTTKITSMHWNVMQHADDDFTLEVDYKFSLNSQLYQGKTAWPKDHYLNQWAAEESTKQPRQRKWIVWYDPDNPNHSSLEKKFPYKEVVSTAVLWCLFLYFLWLGYYVTRYKT